METYEIRVALDDRFRPDDVELDLRSNKHHPLHGHDVRVGLSSAGAVALDLSLTAADLWTALLSTMGLIRHIGYVPTAVEAHTAAATGWRAPVP